MSSPFLSDALISPIMLSLRDCLSAELARSPAGPVCRAFLAWGQVPPSMDGCSCECTDVDGDHGQGDAWVRLVRLDPQTFTSGGAATAMNCPLGWLASIEIGYYRCTPLSEDGGALPAQEATDSALTMAGDMAALLRVLSCCQALDERQPAVDGFTPLGGIGGCAGGAIVFQVALPTGRSQC